MEAQDWCRKYQRSSNVKDLTQAWDLYYHVFRRISKQLPQVSIVQFKILKYSEILRSFGSENTGVVCLSVCLSVCLCVCVCVCWR